MSETAPALDWRLKDVMDYLGVTRQTIHKWVNRKDNPLPMYKPGGTVVRFSSREVIEWATTSSPED